MDEQEKLGVISARLAVDAYRLAHTQLHSTGWHKGIPQEHTPLLNTMLGEFKKQGFNSLQEFFDASQELNILELGFKSKEDFETKATQAEREALEGMWQ
jgi:hypothetical protein